MAFDPLVVLVRFTRFAISVGGISAHRDCRRVLHQIVNFATWQCRR
jgi:hypothetical protein